MADHAYAREYKRSNAWLIFIGVTVGVCGLTVLTVTLFTFLQPESFASTAYLKIEPDAAIIRTNAGRMASYSEYLVARELEIIPSETVLTNVVANLDLNSKWGKKYAGGEPLKTAESMLMLRSRLKARETETKNVLSITVFGDAPAEAADIANGVAEAYHQHRQEAAIRELKTQLAEQEVKVRVAETNLEALQKSLNLSAAEAASSDAIPALDPESVRKLQLELVTLESMLVKEKTQWGQLNKLDPEQRRAALVTTLGADAELGPILSELRQAELKVISLQNEVPSEHPSLSNARAVVADISKRVAVRVEGMMTGLSNRIATSEATIAAINQKLDSGRKSDSGKLERTRPYYAAKARVEELRAAQKLLVEKLEGATAVDSKLPKVARVELLDRAEPGTRPVRPNKARNLLYGAGGGLALGLLLGSSAAWLFASRRTPA